MLTDLILAILHHLAIVSLIVLLAFEFALLKPGLSAKDLLNGQNGANGLNGKKEAR